MPSKHTDRHASSGHSKHKSASEPSLSKTKTSKTSKTSKASSDSNPPLKGITYGPVIKPNSTDLALWKTLQNDISDENSMVLVVGDSQDKRSFKKFLAEETNLKKQSRHEIDTYRPEGTSSSAPAPSSSVMVTTPDDLQKALTVASTMRYQVVVQPAVKSVIPGISKPEVKRTVTPKKLLIVVSRSIGMVMFNISSRIVDVMVKRSLSTDATDEMYSLYLDTGSCYCGVETWKWEYRDGLKDRYLKFGEGIYFSTDDIIKNGLSNASDILSAITPDMTRQFRAGFRSVCEEVDDDKAPGRSTSRDVPESAQTDEDVRWFSKWLNLIASVAAAAVGTSTAAAKLYICWMNAGGFFVKGPLGTYLLGGYFNLGAIGAACMTSASLGVGVATAVYYIPWQKLWAFMKSVLAAIWQKIKEYAVWIWEKLKTLAGSVASALRQGLTGDAFPHMPRPEWAKY